MGRVDRARRIATAAAYGGGGGVVLGAGVVGLLLGQAELARRTIPPAEGDPPRCDGRYGSGDGPPVTLAVIGDSSAAGYGTSQPGETTGALIAQGLAEQLHRPVDLHCLAVVGARSPQLGPQVEAALAVRPDAVVILIGGNDVTHRTRIPHAVAHLLAAVRALRAADVHVVVGTCPDMGAIQPIQPPLRWVARRRSRSLAAAQTIVVVEGGGRTVSLGDLLGPVFEAQPDRMFGLDRFHPSAEGYAAAAAAMLPTLIAALTGVEGQLSVGEGVRTLPQAA